MAPKVKISREEIINTAINMVKNGEEINARCIAAQLNCSTQPIFSNFASMDELKYEVLKKSEEIYREFTENEIGKGEYPVYKIMGMAYILFAKEEKEIFKLLFMRKREKEDGISQESYNKAVDIICESLKLTKEEATLFQLEMWSFVHGIAVMIATEYLELEKDIISNMVSDVYQGLRKRYE